MDTHELGVHVSEAAVFADLCDYTHVTEELGDDAGARIAIVLRGIAERVARRHGGRLVKTLGDGVHLQFPGAAGAIAASLELVEDVRSSDLPCARVGVNAGPMVYAGGDYYGTAVNVAARIASRAMPGDVLVGEAAVACTTSDELRFDCIGAASLKGLARSITLYRAHRERATQPACQAVA